MKYTIGKKSDSKSKEIIYVSNDARIAGNLIGLLVEYINTRIPQESSYAAKIIWKTVYPNSHYLNDWVNKHDIQILLDKFEEELKNRRK